MVAAASSNLDRFANPEIPAREFIALADTILSVKLRDAEAAAFIACLGYEAGNGHKPTGVINRRRGKVGPSVVDGDKFLVLFHKLGRAQRQYSSVDSEWR